jgi:NAD(P)-dependent dehydrogenase (short-subunit alcohol dehydrogenase family)
VSNWRQGDQKASHSPIALPEEKTMKIPGTTIYITGAAGGLGSAIAMACAKAGAHVALFDRDAEGLAALTKNLQAQPNVGKIVPVVADLSSEEGVQVGMGEALKAFDGCVEVLISNIGVLVTGSFEELSNEDWERAFTLNFLTHVWAIRAVLPYMRSQERGHIVLMGSDQGKQPDRELGAYAAAKAAVHSLVKTLARELPAPRITVNGVAPGITRTPLVMKDLMAVLKKKHQTNDPAQAEQKEVEKRDIPLGRFGEPDEVAQAVMFLIQNSFSHGIILPLDGGNVRSM